MVETAHTRQSDDLGMFRRPRFYGSTDRSIVNRRVDAFVVVVIDVFPEQPS